MRERYPSIEPCEAAVRGIIGPMGFLRRLLGGANGDPERVDDPDGLAVAAPTHAESDAAERAYETALMREEQDRLDELVQRQLRYADYAWQPPAEGGERRADDGDGE